MNKKDPLVEKDGGNSEVISESQSSLLRAVKDPIHQESPSGGRVQYDDDFQQLKAEIDKISSASGQADYQKVVELGRRILSEKSKDLRVAVYLVLGEARQNGPRGAAEALRAVRLLIDTYWESLYPAKRRMKGRGSALQFIPDRFGDWMEVTDFQKKDRESLVAIRDDLEAIQSFALKEMGEHAPAFSRLMKDLDKVIRKLPDPEPEAPESGSSTSQMSESDQVPQESDGTDATGTSPSESSVGSQTGAPAEIDSQEDAIKAIRRATVHFRDQDLTSSVPYRLIRNVRWGQLREEPPNENGTTRIEEPREQRRSYLSNLLSEDKYETLIKEGESSFQWETFHFWLDLQRLIASGLDALGEPYEDARDAVVIETAFLVTRIPRLQSLTFRDETPFASALTQEWIETQVRPKLNSEQEDSEKTKNNDDENAARKDYREARKHLSKGNLSDGLSLMTKGSSEDQSLKDEFYRRLYTSILCLNGDKPAVARPILDDLDSIIDQHALDTWNPQLALEVWTNRCRCYRMLAQRGSNSKREELLRQANQAFEKICRVDAERALSVSHQPSL